MHLPWAGDVECHLDEPLACEFAAEGSQWEAVTGGDGILTSATSWVKVFCKETFVGHYTQPVLFWFDLAQCLLKACQRGVDFQCYFY